MKCKYCGAEAISCDGVAVTPPMCLTHYDLAILVEYMHGRGEPVTVESVQGRVRKAQAAGGEWALAVDQVPEILPAYLEKNSQGVLHGALAIATSTVEVTQ